MIILGTNSIKDTGYNVANSLRFNDGSSDYLTRSPSSATNKDLWTLSLWVKRSSVGASGTQSLYGIYADGNNQETLAFDSGDTVDKLYWQSYQGGSVVSQLTTNRLFRDVSAWYHIVIAYDSANGTAGNRMRMYINGVEETSFATDTNPTSGQDSLWNSTTAHTIGRINTTNYFDGYIAEVISVDGQALTPTSFGEFDEDSGIWKPIDVSGLTFGTNGYYLDFEDSANLGNDANGGTDFTENNLTAIDQSTDTCTNNFATFNSLTPSLQSGGVVAYSEGNTKIVTAYSNANYLRYPQAYTTLGVTSGKWYAEFKIGAIGSASVGIANTGQFGSDGSTNPYAGYAASGAVYTNGGEYRADDGSVGSQGTYTEDDIIGCALDMDNLKIYWHKNGTYINSGDPTSGATGTGARAVLAPTTPGGFYVFTAGADNTGIATIEANFGSPSYSESGGETDGNGFGNFNQSVPSGYFALCTKNLAEYG